MGMLCPKWRRGNRFILGRGPAFPTLRSGCNDTTGYKSPLFERFPVAREWAVLHDAPPFFEKMPQTLKQNPIHASVQLKAKTPATFIGLLIPTLLPIEEWLNEPTQDRLKTFCRPAIPV